MTGACSSRRFFPRPRFCMATAPTKASCASGRRCPDGNAFAALTGIDEENVLMGLYVRKTFPKVKVITKINRYSFQSPTLQTMDSGSVSQSPVQHVERHLPVRKVHAELAGLERRDALQARRRQGRSPGIPRGRRLRRLRHSAANAPAPAELYLSAASTAPEKSSSPAARIRSSRATRSSL